MTASLDDLIDDLYGAAHDDAAWPAAMAALKAQVGAAGAMICIGRDDDYQSLDQLYGDCTPAFRELAMAPEVANPFLPAVPRTPARTVLTNDLLMSRRDFEGSVFFNEWARPQGLGAVALIVALNENGIYGYANINTERPAFEDADIASLRAIAPALSRIARIRRRFGALQLRNDLEAADASGLGAVIVDQHRRILQLNATAERLFAEPGNGLAARHRTIALADARDDARLAHLLATATGGVDGFIASGEIAVHGGGGPPLVSLTPPPVHNAMWSGLPETRAALVLVRPVSPGLPRSFEARAMALFGLTPREAALAARLVCGETLRDAARARFISIHTARTQLAQLFAKTGTGQQSQLVALLLGAIPPGS